MHKKTAIFWHDSVFDYDVLLFADAVSMEIGILNLLNETPHMREEDA